MIYVEACTPYEEVYEITPDVSFMKTFWYNVYVHVPLKKRNVKFDVRS